MEEDRESTRYWCHQCHRPVVPILEVLTIKCSSCHGEFMEEMDSVRSDHHRESGSEPDHDHDHDHDHTRSLLTPILLGMMNNPRRRRRYTHMEFEDDEEDLDLDRRDSYERYRRYNFRERGESALDLDRNRDRDRDLESMMRRRRRSSATVLHLLRGARSGTPSDSENNPERVILINPYNQTIIVQGGGSGGGTQPISSLGDYFTGHGLEQLLQHLTENDPNRHGTPPAKKEAVEALPTVTVNEQSVQCSVCLDDFEVGIEAKELPCKHKFHDKCILPWLELHSSCPVCRFELPSDAPKLNQEQEGSESGDGGEGHVRRVSLPWPFSSFFSGPEPGSGSGSSSAQAHRARAEEDNQ